MQGLWKIIRKNTARFINLAQNATTMPQSLDDKINIELVKLQDELGTLDMAVKHIDKAGKISNDVLEAIARVQKRYEELLGEVGGKYAQFLENAEGEMKSQVERLSASHQKQIDDVQSLLDNYLDLAEATAKLPDEIEKIDFPVRLDRMEDSIKNLNDTLLRTQSNMDDMEGRLDKRLKSLSKLENAVANSEKASKTARTLGIISLVGVLALLVFQLLPLLGLMP